jgi:anti-anti-sigma factor
MATGKFAANVRHQPRVAVVDLQGEINSFAEQVLNTAYEEAMSQQPELLLLNFQEVDYINSSGIALIVGILKRVQKDRRPLAACGLSEHYLEIFQITRLADFLHLFSNESDALRHFQAR